MFRKFYHLPTAQARLLTSAQKQQLTTWCTTLVREKDDHYYHTQGGLPCSNHAFLSAVAACQPGGINAHVDTNTNLPLGTLTVNPDLLGLVGFKVNALLCSL